MEALMNAALWRQLVILLPMGAVILTCAFTDFRERKIFNKVTYPAFLVGLVAHTIVFGLDGLLDGLLASFIMFVIGLIIMMTGGLKAGDVKLLMVVGAFVGGAGLVEVSFYTLIFGAAMGILNSVINGYIFELPVRIWHLIRGYFLVLLMRDAAYKPVIDETDKRAWIPFAIPIFIGTVCAITDQVFGLPGWMDAYIEFMRKPAF